VDDRTDDCAFGAMMLLALRPKFRKLRFQMIDDTCATAFQQHGSDTGFSRHDVLPF
jgi:hypothetical protein